MTVYTDLRSTMQMHFSENVAFDEVFSVTAASGRNPFRHPSEFSLLWRSRFVDWAHQREREAVRLARRKNSGYPRLEIPPRTGSKRRMEQPVFKPAFDTLHDIRLRLERSFIFIGSELYYVVEITQDEGDYTLRVVGKDGNHYIVSYSDPMIDLRSIEPQYIVYNSTPAFLHRIPSRSQRQGLNSENTVGLSVWPKRSLRVCDESLSILSSLSMDKLAWSPHYQRLMEIGMVPALRLSKDIAVFHDGESIKTEFRNRLLGEIKEDSAVMNERDCNRPWVVSALMEVGLRPQEGKS